MDSRTKYIIRFICAGRKSAIFTLRARLLLLIVSYISLTSTSYLFPLSCISMMRICLDWLKKFSDHHRYSMYVMFPVNTKILLLP